MFISSVFRRRAFLSEKKSIPVFSSNRTISMIQDSSMISSEALNPVCTFELSAQLVRRSKKLPEVLKANSSEVLSFLKIGKEIYFNIFGYANIFARKKKEKGYDASLEISCSQKCGTHSSNCTRYRLMGKEPLAHGVFRQVRHSVPNLWRFGFSLRNPLSAVIIFSKLNLSTELMKFDKFGGSLSNDRSTSSLVRFDAAAIDALHAFFVNHGLNLNNMKAWSKILDGNAIWVGSADVSSICSGKIP